MFAFLDEIACWVLVALLYVVAFTPASAVAFDHTTKSAFAPQTNFGAPFGSTGKSPIGKRRLRDAAPRVSAKPGCPVTAESHYLFC
jgi:hypothetical protein